MAEMSEARMLVAELEALLAAVHADDPKREILVRIGDALRMARASEAESQRLTNEATDLRGLITAYRKWASECPILETSQRS